MASATSTPAAAASSSRSSRSVSRSAGRSVATTGLPTSSTSPTRLSRIQEKDNLRHLNDRLANYIQRVQELESERSSILFQLEEKDDSKSREMGNVRRLYEEELADVRKSLDGLAGERARLQIDCGNLCEENRKLQARNQKKESELANALAQWRKVEAMLSSKDAEYTKLLSENRRLAEEVADLQEHLEYGVLGDTKNQLNGEILRKVDMENQVQTLKEQLELQRNISEQEVLEIRSRQDSRLVEVDSVQRREFESKLSETIQQLRHDHESQMQQYREELDRTFSSKVQAIDSPYPAFYLTSGRGRLHWQKQFVSIEDLERTLDREREVWQHRLDQKEQEQLSMRSQMFAQLEDYENLLDVKLALDMEINAYRKMLEVEEQRLHLSPSPSQHAAIARTHEHSSRKLRGKKRKYEGASGSSPAYKMSSRSMESGAVSVADVDADGKYVRLKNNSETVRLLSCNRAVTIPKDPGLGGGIISPTWPGNASGSPSRSWLMWIGKGKFGVPCWSCSPRDPTPDKRTKMDGIPNVAVQLIVSELIAINDKIALSQKKILHILKKICIHVFIFQTN
uniref:Lamin L3 n=1 Tax=Sander lucioperca TaxID=283035 RepID=A0A8D0CP50_SANLU